MPSDLLPADYHQHTPLCRHATGSPEEFVAQALALGLPEIGFSDHNPMPTEFDDWRMLRDELPEYFAWVQRARLAAANRIPVRLGLEVDWLDGAEPWIDELTAMAPWDYLIGSVHYLGSWNFDNPKLASGFDSMGTTEAWDRYWHLFAKAARSRRFDLMAHPDLIKKFGHRPPGDLRRWYEPAIAAVAESGAAIELNTAGLFKDVREMYPAPLFLELAHKAGIPLAISSDAHAPHECGRAFAEALTLARNAGYTELVRFSQRQRTTVPIS